ncbi:MAG: serine dehydratase subunit alpha family protein [Clostridia bacterium]|nr:serine dehydratase subunit alpha family protein [Clostridia bacterium]
MACCLTNEKYEYFCKVLEEELVPAMGCTEPIAIAYAAAKAKAVLGAFPDRCEIEVSGNIIKNAKSVVVPHTDGMRGIEAAVIAGLVGGNADASLEVLSGVTEGDIKRMKEVSETLPVLLTMSDSELAFDICLSLYNKDESSFVRIASKHTNIVLIKKNGNVIFEGKIDPPKEKKKEGLSVEEIVKFAEECNIDDVKPALARQIEYNMAIAREGLSGNWGANIGKVYLSSYANDISVKAKAYAAAGSDARMNGCELPVIINSGSGNQGMTASIPVYIYWEDMKLPEEKLYRALALSNLLTLHIKHGIGTLSAYCGAVAAGASAGAGIAYLHGGGFREVAHTLVNALAIDSGLICDGAKASCAAKIATAVENGILGFNLFRSGNQFFGGDGIVKKGVENTIENVCRLARDGMKDTDREILNIMMNTECK